jgi:hypothetical protein
VKAHYRQNVLYMRDMLKIILLTLAVSLLVCFGWFLYYANDFLRLVESKPLTTVQIERLVASDNFYEIIRNARKYRTNDGGGSADISHPVAEYIRLCCDNDKDAAVKLLRDIGFIVHEDPNYNAPSPSSDKVYKKRVVCEKKGPSLIFMDSHYRVILYVNNERVELVYATYSRSSL